jgi:hypothetical protein
MNDLEDAVILSEVLCRVAFRLIERDYRKCPELYSDPSTRLYQLATTLEHEGFRALSMWVSSAAFYRAQYGFTMAEWRDKCIYRARRHYLNHRSGNGWRRDAGPRVTNRGAITGCKVVRRPWGKPRPRW